MPTHTDATQPLLNDTPEAITRRPQQIAAAMTAVFFSLHRR